MLRPASNATNRIDASGIDWLTTDSRGCGLPIIIGDTLVVGKESKATPRSLAFTVGFPFALYLGDVEILKLLGAYLSCSAFKTVE